MICATQLSQAETGLDFVERSWKYPVKFGRSRRKGWKYGFITACWETLTITIHEENQSNGELSEWKTLSLNDIVGVNVVKVKLVTSTDRSEDVILTPYDSSEGGLMRRAGRCDGRMLSYKARRVVTWLAPGCGSGSTQ